MEKEKEEFKPFVPAEKEMKEFSITAVIVGVLLAVVFGAANAYLGLRVGMTVSASIPAAVVSMGIGADNWLGRRVISGRCHFYAACVIFVGRRREGGDAGFVYHHSTCFVWRRSWCVFYGSAAQSINCKRTWGASISGRNGVCGCAASR